MFLFTMDIGDIIAICIILLCVLFMLFMAAYVYVSTLIFDVYIKLRYNKKIKDHKVVSCKLMKEDYDLYNIKKVNFSKYRYEIELDNSDKIYIKGYDYVCTFRNIFNLDFNVPLK